jgi:hypothetical protein
MPTNAIDYAIAKGLLEKLTLRYAETGDQNLMNKMANLRRLLAAWDIRETEFASKWHSLPQPAH